MAKEKAVILFSGGIDSTVLLYSLIIIYECFPFTINYGQRHSKEITAAQGICKDHSNALLKRWKYSDLSVLQALLPSSLTGASEVPNGHYTGKTMASTVVPNRNMILLAIATGYAQGIGASVVAYAAHTEDHYLYPDCRPEFVSAIARAIKEGTDSKVRLIAPLIDQSKVNIVRLGDHLNIPFELTWSCYKGKMYHCGVCSTCIERKGAFKKAGITDPTIYKEAQK